MADFSDTALDGCLLSTDGRLWNIITADLSLTSPDNTISAASSSFVQNKAHTSVHHSAQTPCMLRFSLIFSTTSTNKPQKTSKYLLVYHEVTADESAGLMGGMIETGKTAHGPVGSAPYGRMSVLVLLHRSHEAAGSPSHSAAAIWLHLETQQYNIWHVWIMGVIENLLKVQGNRCLPPEMKVSKMICAPLKKSPNWASQMGRSFGWAILIPYSKPSTASSESGLLHT